MEGSSYRKVSRQIELGLETAGANARVWLSPARARVELKLAPYEV